MFALTAALSELPALHVRRRRRPAAHRRVGADFVLEPMPELSIAVRAPASPHREPSPSAIAGDSLVLWCDVDLPEAWPGAEAGSERLLHALRNARARLRTDLIIEFTHSGATGCFGAVRLTPGLVCVDVGQAVLTPVGVTTPEGPPAILMRSRVRMSVAAHTAMVADLDALGEIARTLQREALSVAD